MCATTRVLDRNLNSVDRHARNHKNTAKRRKQHSNQYATRQERPDLPTDKNSGGLRQTTARSCAVSEARHCRETLPYLDPGIAFYQANRELVGLCVGDGILRLFLVQASLQPYLWHVQKMVSAN